MSEDAQDPERLRRELARAVVDPALLRELATKRVDAPPPPDAPAPRTRGRALPRVRATAATPIPLPTVRVIIELNPDWSGGVGAAREEVLKRLETLGIGERLRRDRGGRHYILVELTADEITALADAPDPRLTSPILRLWRDQPLNPLLDRSVRTVKADACLATFGAGGSGIVVAVPDSGVDATHPHFRE